MYTMVDKLSSHSGIYASVGEIEQGQVVMATCHDGNTLMGKVVGLDSTGQAIDVIHESGLMIKMNPCEPVLLIGD